MPVADYIIRLKDMFTTPLARMESKMNHFEGAVRSTQGSVNSLGSSMVSAFTGGAVVTGITMLAGKLQSLASDSFETALAFQNMTSAIEFASGDRAAQSIQFLDETIDRLGLVTESTYKGFKTFQGALMGTALEGERGLDVFNSVSEAAAVMKLSGEQTEGAFLALGQMMSKGTVSAEELRGQLGERLPGAFQIAARAMGVSTMQLGEMMKAGEVVSEEFLPKFAAELHKTFGPGVLRAQTDFNANWNRFKNYIFEAKVEFGQGLMPYLNEFAQLIPKLDFGQVTDTLSALIGQIQQLTAVFDPLWEALGWNNGFTVLNQFAKYLFIVTRPVSLIFQGITQLFQLIGNGKDILLGFGEALGGLFSMDKDQIISGLDNMTAAFDRLKTDAVNTFTTWKEEQEKLADALWNPAAAMDPTGAQRKNQTYTNGTTGQTGATAKKTKEAGVEKISSGTRNITLNIAKFQLAESIVSQKADFSDVRFQEGIRRQLLAALNDVNIAAQ